MSPRETTPWLWALGVGLGLAVGSANAAVNGGTIGVSANYHPGGSNADQQTRIAQTHDLVVLGTGWADEGPPSTYYQVNPAMAAIVYQSWFDISPGNPDYGTVNANEEWFHHDAAGNRVTVYSTHELSDCDVALCRTNPAYCNCRFGMNLGNAEYRAFVASRVGDIVTGGGTWGGPRGFDGVFFDNTFPNWPYRPSKVSSGWVSATPVIQGSTQTEDQWIADQQGFLASMKQAMGLKTLIFNGCASSANFPKWKDASYAFLQHADGCTMEYWTVNGSGTAATAKTGPDWDRDVELFQGVTDRGKWATPLIGSGVHTTAVNRYGIASMLLIWADSKSCMNFWKGTAEEAIAGRFDATFPEASIDLGTPTERYAKLPNGVASRNFTKGRVLVNPSASTQTVALGETLRTPEGAAVTSVTLVPGTAEILLREVASGEGPATVPNVRRTDRQ